MSGAADAVMAVEPVNRPTCVICPEDFQAYWMGEPLDLTATQFVVLGLLARRDRKVTTRSQILDAARDGVDIDERSVDTIIRRIREKIRAAEKLAGITPRPKGGRKGEIPIETLYGVGWRWHDAAAPEDNVTVIRDGDGAWALPPWEQEVIFRTRNGERAFQIATALGIALPKVMATQTKARTLGIALTPLPPPANLPAAAEDDPGELLGRNSGRLVGVSHLTKGAA